jgi:hypothetical protein
VAECARHGVDDRYVILGGTTGLALKEGGARGWVGVHAIPGWRAIRVEICLGACEKWSLSRVKSIGV